MFMRKYASSRVKRKSFYELQMFLLISGGHIGGKKLSVNIANMVAGRHLEFTFSINALPFYSRASILEHKHIS